MLLGGPSALFIEENMVRWFLEKHPKASPSEIAFINSIEISRCPACGSASICKNAKRRDGVQTYKCLNPLCHRRFNPLANTIFDSRKIPLSEWVEYLIHLFEYHSVTSAASDNRNDGHTGFYWLEKVFFVLRGFQDSIMLGDLVWIDETYVGVLRPDLSLRDDGKRKRGLSENQICVCTATDGKAATLIVNGKGKPSAERVLEAYGPHIQCGSHIVHDDEKAHSRLIRSTASTETVVPSWMTEGVGDDENPMEPINRVHRFFKRFLSRHTGFQRSDLQDWANLFSFIWNTPEEPKIKAMIFISMAVKVPGLLRYRDWRGGGKEENVDKM